MPGTIGPHEKGLLGHNVVTGEGTHMYHATLPMQVAHTHGQMADLEAKGYQDEYIPQEYPKVLTLELTPGEFTRLTVKSKQDEVIARGREVQHPPVEGSTV